MSWTTKRAPLAAVAVLLLGAALGGQPQQSAPAFEAASIKPNTDRISNAIPPSRGNGNYSASNVGLRSLIALAYGIHAFQIQGGPDWLASARFDIVARGPEGTPDGLRPAMMRSLLAERFKLVARFETREQPVYALALLREDGRLGPQMRPSAVPDDSPSGFPSSWVDSGIARIGGNRVSMDTLASMLTSVAFNQRVVNRTGLDGEFQIELRFAQDLSPAAGSEYPSVFTAVREQLGLKLEATRGPVEVLVIDSVERPTGN